MLLVTPPNASPYIVDRFDVQGGTTHDYFLHGSADASSRQVVDKQLTLTSRAHLNPNQSSWQPTTNEGQTGFISKPYYAYGFLNRLESAQLKPGQNSYVDWLLGENQADSEKMLRVHLLPTKAMELVVGQNPSIRQAKEDDSKLDDFQRPFLMMRSTVTPKDTSTFVSVIEPSASVSESRKIDQIANENATILKVTSTTKPESVGPGEEWIVLNATRPVSIPTSIGELQFLGAVGYLAIARGQIDKVFAHGDAEWKKDNKSLGAHRRTKARLVEVSDAGIVIDAPTVDSKPPLPQAGAIVSLKTADGWVYPFTIRQVTPHTRGLLLSVREKPAFVFDRDRNELKGTMFPERTHQGEAWIEY